MKEWAYVFPQIKDAYPTRDNRIFQTRWRKTEGSGKTKKYFCCIVGGDCYGVDVIRPWAQDAKKEMDEAYYKVQVAANHYDAHGEWPKD